LNVEEYISTGILEAYVLGELSDAERAEVELNLNRFPLLREELTRVEEAQEALLMASAVAPPARAKEKLMSQIADSTVRQSSSPSTRKVVVMEQPSSSLKWWQLATAASVSLAIITSYYAVDYRQQLQATSANLQELIAQNRQIASDYNQVNHRLDEIETSLKIIDNPSFKRVIMNGTEGAPDAIASVYYNDKTSEVYLSIQNLRDLSKDKQYQLWAIVDGKPVDVGVFNFTAGLIKMKEVKQPQAFAVTVEPSGGSAAPTLNTMQVIGKI
jgi:anti-sigma-K factor RskA